MTFLPALVFLACILTNYFEFNLKQTAVVLVMLKAVKAVHVSFIFNFLPMTLLSVISIFSGLASGYLLYIYLIKKNSGKTIFVPAVYWFQTHLVTCL